MLKVRGRVELNTVCVRGCVCRDSIHSIFYELRYNARNGSQSPREFLNNG